MKQKEATMIPIRCFSCGKVIADKWTKYEQLRHERGRSEQGRILTELGLIRICCRRMFLTHEEPRVFFEEKTHCRKESVKTNKVATTTE